MPELRTKKYSNNQPRDDRIIKLLTKSIVRGAHSEMDSILASHPAVPV